MKNLYTSAWQLVEEQYPEPHELSELRWKDVVKLMVDFAFQELEKENESKDLVDINTINNSIVDGSPNKLGGNSLDPYKHIKQREDYSLLLHSGMFWEYHPELSGDWELDKLIINREDYNIQI